MQSKPVDANKRTDERWWVPPVLVVILMVGGYLRFTNLKWDNYKWIHPDEAHMQQTLSKIHTPDSGSLLEDISIYFDTHRSPLNVRNQGNRYSYGTLPLFIVRFVSEGLDHACNLLIQDTFSSPVGETSLSAPGQIYELLCSDGAFTGYRSKLVGRLLSATVDMGTILVVFFIGRQLYGEIAGALAAAFVALTAFLIQQAHLYHEQVGGISRALDLGALLRRGDEQTSAQLQRGLELHGLGLTDALDIAQLGDGGAG